jgi:hypothetical protein
MKRRLVVGFLAFFSIGVGVVAPMPWVVGLFDGTVDAPPLLAHLLARSERFVFLLHVVGGGLALLAGPWQLMPRLRARHVGLHRATGMVYVAAVAVAGTAGLVLGPGAWGGPIAGLGFTLLAIAWLATTALGLQRILAGDRAGHRAWIVRSFALAFAAVSLRLQFPLLAAAGVPDAIAYPFVAWSSWVPNLIFAHVVLARRNSAGETPVQRRNARVNELCSENPSR